MGGADEGCASMRNDDFAKKILCNKKLPKDLSLVHTATET